MAKHNTLGTEGEALAAEWLKEQGYSPLHLNWRYSHYEVDIVAAYGDILHFIEVKTRQNNTFGEPEESVDKKKIANLMKAGEEFQYQYPQWKRVQYDILSVTISAGGVEYFFVEDVYL